MNAMYAQPPPQYVSNYSQNLMNMGFHQDLTFMNPQFAQLNMQPNPAQNLDKLSAQMNPHGFIPPPPTKPNPLSDK
jgi:hypothetical protein